jgi:hypothetical protein
MISLALSGSTKSATVSRAALTETSRKRPEATLKKYQILISEIDRDRSAFLLNAGFDREESAESGSRRSILINDFLKIILISASIAASHCFADWSDRMREAEVAAHHI